MPHRLLTLISFILLTSFTESAYGNLPQSAENQTRKTNSPEMIYVRSGSFTMGCTDEQGGDCFDDEKPAHNVTVGSFYIGKYEITQGEYEALMGTNPSFFTGVDNLPVENLTWYAALEYCNALSIAEGLEPCYVIDGENTTCDFTKNGYRLPTEAEWEYAARGGNQSQRYKYPGSDDVDEVAWFYYNEGVDTLHRTRGVGTKRPNELGTNDMSGNVQEWCWDWYNSSYYSNSAGTNPKGQAEGSERVIRGGGWHSNAIGCRVAYRSSKRPTFDHNNLGFRLARSVVDSDGNLPPVVPNTPVPDDETTGVSTTPVLQWQCSDPNGDLLSYDIYFGESASPALVVSDYSSASYTPDTLSGYTTYQWRIVAKDGKDSLSGPVWNFTTGEGYGAANPGELVLVEGGAFTMGCTVEQDGDCFDDEKPTHNVTVSSFYIGKYEITQGEYESLMRTNPSYFSGSDNLPVENLTWYAALEYCNALSIAEGLEPCYLIDGEYTICNFSKNGYRLPTEAEWEFAARGGNESKGYKFPGSDDEYEVAWHYYNPGEDGLIRTHNVGMKKPNELGIHDMSGNVQEWCWDWYSSNYYNNSPSADPIGPGGGAERVIRGGGWHSNDIGCRVAYRSRKSPRFDHHNLGFRLARNYDGSVNILLPEVSNTPDDYLLKQNYPNPFNPQTTITALIPDDGYVNLAVYNILGQKVAELHSGELTKGRHDFIWNGRTDSGNPAASGVYLLRLTGGGSHSTIKMILQK